MHENKTQPDTPGKRSGVRGAVLVCSPGLQSAFLRTEKRNCDQGPGDFFENVTAVVIEITIACACCHRTKAGWDAH